MKTNTIILLSLFVFSPVYGDTYKDPIDGREYRAEWRTYQPKDGVKESDGPVNLLSSRLLSTQQEFDNNVSLETLSEFMKATQANIEKHIGTPSTEFELLINTTLFLDKDPEFEIASQGEVTKEQLQKIHDGLAKMKGLKTKSGALKYQAHYKVK